MNYFKKVGEAFKALSEEMARTVKEWTERAEKGGIIYGGDEVKEALKFPIIEAKRQGGWGKVYSEEVNILDVLHKPIKHSKNQRGFIIALGFDGLTEIPRRATAYSAGYDIRAAISEPIILHAGETVTVPTGIAVFMGHDECFELRPRSGFAKNDNITLQDSPSTIDADHFPNTFSVVLRNEGERLFVIEPRMRIAQGVFTKYLITDDDDAEDDFGKPLRSGGFGHTGKF